MHPIDLYIKISNLLNFFAKEDDLVFQYNDMKLNLSINMKNHPTIILNTKAPENKTDYHKWYKLTNYGEKLLEEFNEHTTFLKLKKATFNILDVAYGERDAYIRWEMVLYTKGGTKPLKNLGMSQLRFNSDGKILYHQDHWDYSEILQQMPLIKHVINT